MKSYIIREAIKIVCATFLVRYIMVSRTVLLLFAGQIVIALILLYFLPVSDALDQKINKKSRPLITLSHGEVRGSLGASFTGQKYYARFLGIPYAQVPVGELRFAPPKPLAIGWNGTVREATKPPAKCLQLEAITGDVIGNEDCLALNLYVPLECCGGSETQCPIMVWFHPGDFLTQDGSYKKFGPQMFMEKNVVLISINYRLGPLGFLSLENEEAPGNLGLKDQNLALQWIQNEASNFCADSNRITIFGSGSGATSAILQMLSPQNSEKKLFQGVIAQSGTPLMNPIFDIEGHKKAAVDLAKNVGCKKEILKCLKYKVDPTTLILAGKKFRKFWVPKIDKGLKNAFIPDLPEQLLKKMKNDHLKAVILGHNSEEGLEKIAPFLQDPQLFVNFTARLPEMIFGDVKSSKLSLHKKIVKVLKRAYIPDGKTNIRNIKYATNLVSDYAFSGSVATTLDLLKEFHPRLRSYFYHYSFSGSQSLCDKHVYYGWKYSIKLQLQNLGLGYNMRNGHGICRGDEMLSMFIFGEEPPPVNSGPLTETDKTISKQMIQIWTDFAKNSQPTNDKDIFQWSQYDKASRRYAFIRTTNFEMKSDDLYWTRMQVFKVVHKLLQRDDAKDLDLTKIQDLVKNQILWHANSASKTDL